MTPTATFASLCADLLIIEKSAEPIFEGPRQTGTKPGIRHQFKDHRCVVSGQKSIEWVRSRMRAPDGPDVWEIDASDIVPVPVLLAELATADVDRVREILAAEREHADPNRQIIVDTCEQVLERHGASERKPGQKVVAA